MWPFGARVPRGASRAPGPKVASTLSRTASRSMPTVPRASASSPSSPVNARTAATVDSPCQAVPGEDGGGGGVLVEQAEQQVLGADVVGMQPAGLLLRPHDDLPGLLGEPFEHRVSPFAGAARGRSRTSCALPAG